MLWHKPNSFVLCFLIRPIIFTLPKHTHHLFQKFSLSEKVFQNTKSRLKIFYFSGPEPEDKVEILSAHNILCRKSAAVRWKIFRSLSPRFVLTHDAAVYHTQ